MFDRVQYLEYWVHDPVLFTIVEPNPLYNTDTEESSCVELIVYGCTNSIASNYNIDANVEDNTCEGLEGCTEPLATNYNIDAVEDDGSCFGCTDVNAVNYNIWAGIDDESCIVLGCTNDTAVNFNESANTDDGCCLN